MSRVVRLLNSFGLVALVFVLLSSPIGATQTASSSSIDRWLSNDSFTQCDEIGWSITDGVHLLEIGVDGDLEAMWPACVGGRGTVAACGTIEGDGLYFSPPTAHQWIACYLLVMNGGRSAFDVSMFDFALVDGSGRKYTNDLNAQASIGTHWMVPTTTLRPQQTLEGAIAFSVPESAKMPLVLEIDPLLDFSLGRNGIGQIVIPKLMPVDGLLN